MAIMIGRPRLTFEKIEVTTENGRAYIAGDYSWETLKIESIIEPGSTHTFDIKDDNGIVYERWQISGIKVVEKLAGNVWVCSIEHARQIEPNPRPPCGCGKPNKLNLF